MRLNIYIKQKYKSNHGFTLVELMVSLSIFVVVVLVVMGSVLSILDLNRKIQSKKVAMDNLNFALESMARTIKFGTKYHCGATAPLTSPSDCAGGSSSLSLTASDGSLVTYTLSGTGIQRLINSTNALNLTSPEVTVNSITFWVLGSSSYGTDNLQPRVVISMSITAGSANKAKTQTTFKIETTVSQRKLDI